MRYVVSLTMLWTMFVDAKLQLLLLSQSQLYFLSFCFKDIAWGHEIERKWKQPLMEERIEEVVIENGERQWDRKEEIRVAAKMAEEKDSRFESRT